MSFEPRFIHFTLLVGVYMIAGKHVLWLFLLNMALKYYVFHFSDDQMKRSGTLYMGRNN